MKIFELAKELNIENKELITIAQDLGIEAKSHMNVISDEDVEKIKDFLNVNIASNKQETISSEEIETPKPLVKEQFKPDLTRMICLKNIASGKLVYTSKRQIGYKIEWEKPGDTNYIELGEFIALKNSDSRFVTAPWVRIMEDDEYEILKYANVFKYYEEILGLKNVSDILRLDNEMYKDLSPDAKFEKFKKKFDKLPEGYKNSVIEQAAQMIKNGELDSIKIKNYIEQSMGIELDILIKSDGKPVDNSIEIK